MNYSNLDQIALLSDRKEAKKWWVWLKILKKKRNRTIPYHQLIAFGL